MNGPESFESNKENIYEQVDLGDAMNGLNNIHLEVIDEGVYEFMFTGPISTIEQRYNVEQKNTVGNEEKLKIVKNHPEKIKRLNAIIFMMNKNMNGEKDPILHMLCYNEFQRLAQGPSFRFYHEPGTDPDLLVIDEENPEDEQI